MIGAPAPVVGVFVCSRARGAVGGVFGIRAAPVADACTVAGAGPAKICAPELAETFTAFVAIEDGG